MKIAALAISLVAPVLLAQDISRLLPDSAGGWMKSDSTRLFVGDQLFKLIDGGAEIFKEYGFNEVVAQRYSSREDSYIDVEIYRMNDSSSAYGVFSLFTHNTGRRTHIVDQGYEGDRFILMWKGRFYVSVSFSDSSGLPASIRLAKEIDGRIPGSGKPALVTLFEGNSPAHYDDQRIAFVRGGLALYGLSRIPFGTDLKFDEGICLERSSAKIVVLAYSDESSCRGYYRLLTDHLKNEKGYDPAEEDRDSIVFSGTMGYVKLVRTRRFILLATSIIGTDVERELEQMTRTINGSLESGSRAK